MDSSAVMTKIDPYTTLGVDRTADKKAIRSAYRRRAKRVHPDAGGSPEKFGALQLAHDVLTDDARRAKYDTTGDIDENTTDNTHSAAVNALAIAFNLVLQKCAESGTSPLEKDLVLRVTQQLKTMIGEQEKQHRILSNMRKEDVKMRGRFKVGKDKTNFMEHLVEARITTLNQSIVQAEGHIRAGKEALGLVNAAVFEQDPEPYETPGTKMMNQLGATTYYTLG